jgi:hypothetical protein
MPAFISKSQAARLKRAARRYKKMKLRKPWKKRTDDDLWRKVLGQVVVIGRAEPGERLQRNPKIGSEVSIKKLNGKSDAALRKYLHKFFLNKKFFPKIHVAYVGRKQGWRNDWKAEASARNFKVLMGAGGPRQFFQCIANFEKEDERIAALTQRLERYGDKGARDTLIDLRLAKNCMALDTRIYGVLKKVGARVSPADIYKQVERELIKKVATPLKISGALLDRILFGKYEEILERL